LTDVRSQKSRAVVAGLAAADPVVAVRRGLGERILLELADHLAAQQLVDRRARFLARRGVCGDRAHLLLHFCGDGRYVERAGEPSIGLVEDLYADQLLLSNIGMAGGG